MVRGWLAGAPPSPVSWDELWEGGRRRDSGFSTAVVLCSRKAWRWGRSRLKLRCPGHLRPPAGVVAWAFFSEHAPGPAGNKPGEIWLPGLLGTLHASPGNPWPPGACGSSGLMDAGARAARAGASGTEKVTMSHCHSPNACPHPRGPVCSMKSGRSPGPQIGCMGGRLLFSILAPLPVLEPASPVG